jgi:hypothetical protein
MTNDLIVPVYIDTNSLLDLLAWIEGGFSVVEKVTSRSATTAGSERTVSAEGATEFGIPNVLSLLKINLGGALASKKGEETGKQTESERYHTYGSLLFRLRAHLDDENAIKRLSDDRSWEAILPSDFVEVRGMFRPNPLADALRIINRLIGIMQVFAGTQGSPQGHGKKGQVGETKFDQKQMGQISKFFDGILSDIEKGSIRTFVVDLGQPRECRAVFSLFTEYLRDPTMTEVSYKEFRLFGVVVRKVLAGEKNAIDLLRGTGMGGMGKQVLDPIVTSLSQMEGMNLPSVETAIDGPALEIVPIAIFV